MPHPLVTLTGQLITNGIRFRYLRRFGKTIKPQAISLEVTHRCIARCLMCNIWRIPKKTPVLSVDQWLALLSKDLFTDLVELDITGGEPFLREDLAELFTAICELKGHHLTSLKSVAITTNGFLTGRVIEETKAILMEARHRALGVVMVCAMDAVGDVHDNVRQYPGAWEKVNRTIQGLRRLRTEFPNLIIGLKTTVLPFTVDHLDAIVTYARQNDLFTIISPCIITEGRYLNPDRAKDLVFNSQQTEKMIRFFQNDTSRWSFHDTCLVDYLKTGRMKKPCSCGFNYFFIRSQGSLLPCPMIDKSPGNVTQTPIEKLLASDATVRIRRHAGKMNPCRHCTEPGLERYSLPCEGWRYLSLLPKMGGQQFLQLHRHMGLDKYFHQQI
ncbi:MAG: radical SAM protein [Desulfobacteraceae bacterium]